MRRGCCHVEQDVVGVSKAGTAAGTALARRGWQLVNTCKQSGWRYQLDNERCGLRGLSQGDAFHQNESGKKKAVIVQRQGYRNGRSLLSAEPVRRGEEEMVFRSP